MKTIAIVKYLFTLIGAGMLIGAFFLFKNTQDFLADALIAEGTVIDLIRSRSDDSYTYKPVVVFTTQSGTQIEFTSTTSSNPPSYDVGEVVEVLYQESSPAGARINGFFSLWGGAAILGGMGSIFFLVGFSIVLFGYLNAKKIEYLKNNGTRIKAAFQSVEINSSLRVNGRSPYKIYAQWKNPRTSKIHVFSSENIWFDPTDYIQEDEVSVLIERDNPKKYYMDISFLPEVAD